ncbi:electron transfer flavoprotein subunit beta/FixA family protein [Halopenitus sp. POP-27]|uniref:electron transfer flavoprotein subunit beta/FixA family protein n=1 Tax=Halopenitus sp. POP-27 TaxID=2994425 RepID=UPI0024694BB5|nr:electron transfer flavoprotein subunit beta/FixA family protein [Halopenitus sp. POP-27]
MKALVTVKEVATVGEEFEIDETEIPPKYLETELNEWDSFALEEAVQLREADIIEEVVTVTIGPESCEDTIRQALAKGADRGIRIWDEALEDVPLLDVNAKTEILSAVVESENPDLILSGVQAGDDGFGATGVSLAREIGFQWGAVVNHLHHEIEDGVAAVRRELEGGIEEETEIELPAILTIQSGINEPRYASMRGIRQARQKELAAMTLADLGVTSDAVTPELRLTDMYEPETESAATVFEGDADETAGQLADLLENKGVVQ